MMSTLSVLIVVLCIYALGYRYYSAFLAAKVLVLNDERNTPAHTLKDGQDYLPTPKWVLFGQHFAAIAGAGPLVGPTLAAQFGFAPGLIWLVAGAVIAGAVQDFTVLVASVRHKGKSLAEIARTEISPFTGRVVMIAILFILLVTLAGLGIVVVNALSNSPWGVFTIGMTIPIAFAMGIYMFKGPGGKIRVTAPSIGGVAALMASLIGGRFVANSAWAGWLTFNPHQITLLLVAYGFFASILPVWLLLTPRGYLSTYLKLGTIGALILGIFIVHPTIQFPMTTSFIHGGGPIIGGKLFPFLFVTVACGAISGFHSLVASGTTSKMLDKETDARFVGYGAMVAESLVGVMALIAACSMMPGDYYAINTTPEVFARLGMHTVNLGFFSHAVGENLTERTGGAVSLAVGMAQIFRGIAQISAVTIAAELGNITRFEGARQLMGYSGAVPSEESSGKRMKRGSITKTGNAHLRRIAIEAAWSYRLRPGVGPALRKRQEGVPEEIKEIAWKAQIRLSKRYARLPAAGKDQRKIITAVGRELLGFVWAIGIKAEAAAKQPMVA
jgi:carbon starvation protein